ncbi:adenosylcobinamide-phosphate synthase CbiB [Ignavigranum ruoffiae]|uniref:Cobalamin biosynthesis protein CobD n=1 Tax=Ignavigranum ruoffiae TaxID=89093 RepID=A0A1H9CE95_9LACT|nr:adenosylcobinamide-phosphate synthase CbiB [Ignavigranum ruoffiae]SEP99550.1 adenosylcobinamide-phosphate synthase [Ignavigranum ruoffiae]
MNMNLMMFFGAFLLDLFLGDPYSWPHPVKLMGKWINWFLNKSDYQNKSKKRQQLLGYLLIISLIILVVCIGQGVLLVSSHASKTLYIIIGMYFNYTCFSIKCLRDESEKVLSALQNNLASGRKQLSMIVGRDTEQLSETEVYKALIETIAENTVDGFIAPALFIAFLGPIGGLVYKAINTLDSMVGYRYSPYTYVGKASAQIDDLVNYVPARIGYIVFIISSLILNYDWKSAISIGWRDRYQHLSPNSGWSEASVAGALGIELGGGHLYKGNFVEKPSIGESKKIVSVNQVYQTLTLMYYSGTILSLVIGLYLVYGG